MYKFKSDQGWRRFDLSSPSRKDANLQMCAKLEEVLVDKELHFVPKLYIVEDCDKDDV